MKRGPLVLLVVLLTCAGVILLWPGKAPDRGPLDESPDAAPTERAHSPASLRADSRARPRKTRDESVPPPQRREELPIPAPSLGDEIAFHGQVVYSDLAHAELEVRLNVLDIPSPMIERFAADRLRSWYSEDWVRRSKPRTLQADASFHLQGEPPPVSAGAHRRYVVEVCIAADEDLGWPVSGVDGHLPVAISRALQADAGSRNGPLILKAQAPHQIRVHVPRNTPLDWAREGIAVELFIDEQREGARLSLAPSWAPRRCTLTWPQNATEDWRGPLCFQVSTLANALELSRVDMRAGPFATSDPDLPLLVDGVVDLHLRSEPRAYLVGWIGDVLPTNFSDDDMNESHRAPPLREVRVGLYPSTGASAQAFDDRAGREFLHLRANPIFDIATTGPGNPRDPRSWARFRGIRADAEQRRTWLGIGWVPAGRWDLLVEAPDGRRWASRDLTLGVGQAHFARLESVAPARQVRLVLPGGIAGFRAERTLVRDASGQALASELGNPPRNSDGDAVEPWHVILPTGARSIETWDNFPEQGPIRVLHAAWRAEPESARLLLRQHPTRLVIGPETEGREPFFALVTRVESQGLSQYGSGKKAFGIDYFFAGHLEQDEVEIAGLAPGEYWIQVVPVGAEGPKDLPERRRVRVD